MPETTMKNCLLLTALGGGLLLIFSQPVRAWDYEGHRVANQLALAALPAEFPAFVKTPAARERIAFLSGEPDRWRNMTTDYTLSHYSGPDHYLDLEELEHYGLTPRTLPAFRYEFTSKLALARAATPDKFEPIDPARNKDRTREIPGLAPWAIVEYFGKLRSGFSYLKAFLDYGGTAEEIANAQANIIYLLGVMGHYVADSAQPLHVTKHHHGWVGENPNGYTTNRSIHQWIDGGFFAKTGGVTAEPLQVRIQPARIVGDPLKPDDLFQQVMSYLVETHGLVEPLYQLDKAGKLSGISPEASEGRAFLETQLVRGGQMLGNLWFTAWQQATEDRYLIGKLKERAAAKP